MSRNGRTHAHARARASERAIENGRSLAMLAHAKVGDQRHTLAIIAAHNRERATTCVSPPSLLIATPRTHKRAHARSSGARVPPPIATACARKSPRCDVSNLLPVIDDRRRAVCARARARALCGRSSRRSASALDIFSERLLVATARWSTRAACGRRQLDCARARHCHVRLLRERR